MGRFQDLEVEVERLRNLLLEADCATCTRLECEQIEAHNAEHGEGLAEAALAAHHATCGLWQEQVRIYEINARRAQNRREVVRSQS